MKRVFLGVTGASGAPYARGSSTRSSAAGAEVGLCASRPGSRCSPLSSTASRASRDDVLARFVGDAAGVTVYDTTTSGPYASGSAKVDAYVISPCSMSTVGTLATGAMANLIHRAASVALKERRKLVLVPRETPLSSIHLRGLATLHEAGAVILFGAPGFYHGAETIQDLVDFVVARASTRSASTTAVGALGPGRDARDPERSSRRRSRRCSTGSRRSTT